MSDLDIRMNQYFWTELNWNKERLKPISLEQGEKMAKELKCAKYVECSAKSQVGLKSVFDEALLTHFEPFDENDKKKKSIFARLLPKCLKPKVFA